VSDKVGEVSDIELTDAVVIRKQDQFAPIALYAYCHAVRNAADIISEANPGANFDPLIDELNAIADLFANYGDEAAHHPRKLPTP